MRPFSRSFSRFSNRRVTTPSRFGPSPSEYTIYESDGTTKRGSLPGRLDPDTNVFTIQGGDLGVRYAIGEGDKLRIDNRASLAFLVYHRYQLPDESYYPWDQYRGPGGEPLYPQRDPEPAGPGIASLVAGGGTHTGRFDGKVIMLQNLLDIHATPWQADWYSNQVAEALGDGYDDQFRIWFNDNADHLGHAARLWSEDVSRGLGYVEGATSKRVDYGAIVDQALRDVVAWVEQGVDPARSTQYEMVDSQVILAESAEARRGIQPVVDLTAGDAKRIDVAVGESVSFEGTITAPPGAGAIIDAEWDLTGTGEFEAMPIGDPGQTVEVAGDVHLRLAPPQNPFLPDRMPIYGDPVGQERSTSRSLG